MFGLEDDDAPGYVAPYSAPRALAGTADPAPFYEFTNKQAGWYSGVLEDPAPGVSLKDGTTPVTIPGGTLVRVYKGKLPTQSGNNLVTPNSAGQFIVEPAPDDKSHFWSFYVETPESLALLQSPEWQGEAAVRTARLVAVKIDPAMLASVSAAGVDPDEFNGIGLPSKGKKPDSTPAKPPAPSAPGASGAAGIGIALAILAVLASSKK